MNETTIYPTALEARVAARNARNEFINAALPGILATMKTFIGKKVGTREGMTAKLRAALAGTTPAFTHLYFRASSGNIIATFRAEAHYESRFTGTTCATYSEEVVYLGEYGNDGLLEKVGTCDPRGYRTNFSADEIICARNAMPAAREVLYAAERRLCGFGEHDNNA